MMLMFDGKLTGMLWSADNKNLLSHVLQLSFIFSYLFT